MIFTYLNFFRQSFQKNSASVKRLWKHSPPMWPREWRSTKRPKPVKRSMLALLACFPFSTKVASTPVVHWTQRRTWRSKPLPGAKPPMASGTIVPRPVIKYVKLPVPIITWQCMLGSRCCIDPSMSFDLFLLVFENKDQNTQHFFVRFYWFSGGHRNQCTGSVQSRHLHQLFWVVLEHHFLHDLW